MSTIAVYNQKPPAKTFWYYHQKITKNLQKLFSSYNHFNKVFKKVVQKDFSTFFVEIPKTTKRIFVVFLSFLVVDYV